MVQDRIQRIEAVFDAALALPPKQRAAFVARECAGDSTLRAEVNRLLENDSRAGDGFLAPPPPDPRLAQIIKSDHESLSPGTRIGAYTIQSLIAQGGMGTVYHATQDSPRRNVALKVLHGGLWSAAAQRRFEHESQVLSHLQHPNIAQVYEAGRAIPCTPQGTGGGEVRNLQPHRSATYSHPLAFFAMEYVPNARRFTDFANENHLDIPARLALFLQVCDAIQHGHGKGIIHRDLKPANILVGGDDVAADHRVGRRPIVAPDITVRVIDFGVARVVDSDVAMTTMHTETGQLIGTLAYMSPEQCDADPLGLDVRSDVYSLGILLYELLCGRLPYDVSKTSIVAAARAIREAEPIRPIVRSGRHFAGRSLRDLETILLKSLEKDRSRRYASVADLARDIRHCLNREPIDARPPTAWTKAIRWTIRRPRTATAIIACCIAAIVFVATAFSVWWVNHRPHRLVLTDRGHESIAGVPVRQGDRCVLYTFGGRPLKEWSTVLGGIAFSSMTYLPTKLGGGRVILIGFRGDSDTYAGKLCAFDADGPYESPIWTRSIEKDDMPASLRDAEPSRWNFGVAAAWLMDVFPDKQSPGEEIVVVFGHPYSQRALRIYALNGDLLYQVWQDGGMENAHWMRDARLLVFAGGDEAVKHRIRDARVVNVLFSIRPQFGFVSTAFLVPAPGPSPLHHVWYRYMHPAATLQLPWTASLDRCLGLRAAGNYVDVRVEINVPDGPPATLRFTIDNSGKELNEPRRLADTWNKCPYPLPPVEIFQLRDDPPTDVYRPPTRPPAAPPPATTRPATPRNL